MRRSSISPKRSNVSPPQRKSTKKKTQVTEENEVVEDLFVYGSFKHKEPSEQHSTINAKNNPRKLVVQELSHSKSFKSK